MRIPGPASSPTPLTRTSRWLSEFLAVSMMLSLAGLDVSGESKSEHPKIKVLATTAIVGDVVQAVAGDAMELSILMPAGTDPHTFQPVPKDIMQIPDAVLIFMNGAGLETALDPFFQDVRDRVVDLSAGLSLRTSREEPGHHPGEYDPHVWLDPQNVIHWVDTIQAALTRLVPDRAEYFKARADSYKKQLDALDRWIREQTGPLTPDQRLLVSDHEALGYFAQRYGFKVAGSVLPGFSTLAEPSARQMADLENAIRESKIGAVFVDFTVNPQISERVAEDTGARLVPLVIGTLDPQDKEADSYLSMMRYDVIRIVEALKAKP